MAQLSVAATLKPCIANSELTYPLPHPISSTLDDGGESRDLASLNIISTLREFSGQYWSMNHRLPLNPSSSRSIAMFVSFADTGRIVPIENVSLRPLHPQISERVVSWKE